VNYFALDIARVKEDLFGLFELRLKQQSIPYILEFEDRHSLIPCALMPVNCALEALLRFHITALVHAYSAKHLMRESKRIGLELIDRFSKGQGSLEKLIGVMEFRSPMKDGG
jgi:hypothetical protein